MPDWLKYLIIALAATAVFAAVVAIVSIVKKRRKNSVERVEKLFEDSGNFKKRTDFLLDESKRQVNAIIKNVENKIESVIDKKRKRCYYSTIMQPVEKISYNIDVGISCVSFLGWWFTTPPYSKRELTIEEVASLKSFIKGKIETNAKLLLNKYKYDERLKNVQLNITVEKSGDISVIFSAENAIGF